MNESEIRQLVQQWVDAWNSQDRERITSLYADDVVFYQAPAKKTFIGRDYLINRFEDFLELMPDWHNEIQELYIDGDTAIVKLNGTGTQTGPFLEFRPTGRMLDMDFCLIFKFKDSKIIKHTTFLDTATLLRSLGLITLSGAGLEAA